MTLLRTLALGTALALPASLPALPPMPPGLPLELAQASSPAPVERLLDLGALPELDSSEPPVKARPDAVVITYGAEIPRVTCLPYRACTILLSPDETILNLAIGDSERWRVQNFSADGTAPVVVFKPSRPNLLTNLVIKTTRRLYHLELLSPAAAATDPSNKELAYDALVTWTYPHSWAQTVAAPSPPPPPSPPASSGPGETPIASPSDLHFSYRFDRPFWRRHRLSWIPEVVYDDGHRTFIRLPQGTRDLPAVLLIDEAGEPSPIEASLTGPQHNWLLVPAVASRIRLVQRSGDKARHLTIVRTR